MEVQASSSGGYRIALDVNSMVLWILIRSLFDPVNTASLCSPSLSTAEED